MHSLHFRGRLLEVNHPLKCLSLLPQYPEQILILCIFHLVSSMLDLDQFDPYIKSVCSGVIILKNVCQTPFATEENPKVYLKFVPSSINNVGSRPFSKG